MSTLTSTQLQQQYIAYFGRPGDPAGLKYWLSSSSGISSAREFADKIYAQDEYKTSTVGGKSTEQQVNQLYKNLFGREADAAGLIYWTGEIEAGNLVLSNVAYDLIWAASNPVDGNSAQASADADALANKVSAAEAFTTEVEASTSAILAYQPESTDPWKSGAAFNEAVSFISTATATNTPTATDVTASITTITTVSTSTSGSNFTLTNTNNQTTGGADNFTGGSGDDSFLATSDGSFDNGDVIDGGAGTDTLTARYAVSAAKTVLGSVTNVEHFVVDADDSNTSDAHILTVGVDGFTGLKSVTVKNADAVAAQQDTVLFNNIAAGVELGITNGDADHDSDFVFKSTTGTDDSATLNLNAALADEVTIAGIETITIDGESGKSTIDTMVTAAATKYIVTGAGKVVLSDIANTVKTVDGSATTGGMVLGGVGSVNATITGGTGDDTVAMGTSLNTSDTIDLGDGTDRIKVGGSETTALPSVTNVEIVEVDVDTQKNTSITVSGKAFPSATQFAVDALVDADGNSTTITFSNMDDDDQILIEASGGDTDGTGTKVTGTLTSNSSEDDVTVTFGGIGALTTNAVANTGFAVLTLDSHETINLVANKNSTGSVNTNGIDTFAAATAKSLVITSGGGEIDIDAITNTTALTSIDSTGSASNVTIDGLDASKLVYKAGSGNNVISLTGLNSDDQLIGGSASKDKVTATAVTGLTAITGILNIQDFESVYINATGVNTLDASKFSGVDTLGIYGGSIAAKQTIKNLPAGVAFSLGNSSAEFEGNYDVDISLADETGDADSITIKVDNRGGGETNADIYLSSTVETLTLDLLDLDDTNDALVDLADADVAKVILKGGYAAASLTLGTLADETLTVDATDLDADFTFTAGTVASGMTVDVAAAQTATAVTLSAKDDTLTIASTGGVVPDYDGGAGSDTVNFNVKSGFVTTSELENFETVNFIVNAGDDITLGANGGASTQADAVSGATTVNISGGNSLSTFEIGDKNAASTDRITTAVDVDSSAFQGNVFLEYADDILTASTDVDAGALLTDNVYATFNSTGDDIVLPFTGVEIFTAYLDSGNEGGETYTFDVDTATGLKEVELQTSTSGATTVNIDDYISTVSVQLGTNVGDVTANVQAFDGASTININHKNADGASDVVNLELKDTDDTNSTIDINAAGTETLNIAVSDDAESHTIDLAGVTATTGSKTTVNLTGGVSGDGVNITTTANTTNVIDAGDYLGTLTISDRNAAAMTITSNTGADTLRMENSADVLDAGSGSDTLNIVKTLVLGGIAIDLTSTTDQITTFNGASNTGVQKGFENVDLSGVGGSFGASITATEVSSTVGSTITGTKNADTITLGTTATSVDNIHTDGGVESSANKNDAVDIISNFTVGASGDQVDLDISELETAGAVVTGITLNFVQLSGTATNATEITAASSVSFQTYDTDGETANANTFILLDTGSTYADADTAVDVFEVQGAATINHNTNLAASDAFLFAYENSSGGVTVAAAFMNAAADNNGSGNGANVVNGTLDGVDLFTFDDVSNVATLTTGNFDFV